MGKTSSTAKQKWNAENYTQIKVSIKPEIAAAFKAACEAAEISMASVLSKFMEDYAAAPRKKAAPQVPVDTRRQRRNEMKSLLNILERMRDGEERYRDNIPENLRSGSAFDAADECVSVLSEGLDLLETAYP